MISIVMPVYNTGVFLEESIKCILAQTYNDFELICVDDCSTNQLTKRLLFEYEKIDKRIQVIHLPKNLGAAQARNIGLKEAKGEYIIFLDADDMFESDMLEKMAECLRDSSAEVCICGYRKYSENTKSIVEECGLRMIPNITDRKFHISEIGEDGLLYCASVPWNKMCKTEFLRNNNIHFQNLTTSNDVYFAFTACLLAKHIICCENGRPLVTYRVENGNQITSYSNLLNYWYAIEYVLETRKKNDYDIEWRQIMVALLSVIIDLLHRTSDEGRKRKCYEIVQLLVKKNKEHLQFENRKYNKYVLLFLEKEYESKWFEKINDFERQIEDYADSVLLDWIENNKKVVIWGNGKRGKAFQRFCKKKSVVNIRVTDKNNDKINYYTEEGYLIICTEDVYKYADIVVASNFEIYKELKAVEKLNRVQVVNLENYCPL